MVSFEDRSLYRNSKPQNRTKIISRSYFRFYCGVRTLLNIDVLNTFNIINFRIRQSCPPF